MNDQASREMTTSERFRRWLFRLLFAAECKRLGDLEVRLITCAHIAAGMRSPYPLPAWLRCPEVEAVDALYGRLQRATTPKPARAARVKLQGGMEREQIETMLSGQQGLPALKAVEGLLMNKLVELSDKSTDAPHAGYMTADGPVPAFTNDERLHLAGGAFTAAELLADLQELVVAKDKPKAVAS